MIPNNFAKWRKLLPGRKYYLNQIIRQERFQTSIFESLFNTQSVTCLDVSGVKLQRGTPRLDCENPDNENFEKRNNLFIGMIYSFTKHFLKVLNGLDKMGYRVVSSSNLITGYAKFDTRDMVWTLHKAREEWEASSK